MKIWRQKGKVIESDYRLVVLRILFSMTPIFVFIGGEKMFANIPEIETAICLAAAAVIGWILCVQYSKYIQHKKKHVNDEKYNESFAVIPYFIVPVLFGALGVVCGLWVGDYLSVKGYIAGPEEIIAVVIGASVIAYAVLDHYIVSHVGDAVYFQTIEADIVKSAASASDSSKEDLKALLRELLK